MEPALAAGASANDVCLRRHAVGARRCDCGVRGVLALMQRSRHGGLADAGEEVAERRAIVRARARAHYLG